MPNKRVIYINPRAQWVFEIYSPVVVSEWTTERITRLLDRCHSYERDQLECLREVVMNLPLPLEERLWRCKHLRVSHSQLEDIKSFQQKLERELSARQAERS